MTEGSSTSVKHVEVLSATQIVGHNGASSLQSVDADHNVVRINLVSKPTAEESMSTTNDGAGTVAQRLPKGRVDVAAGGIGVKPVDWLGRKEVHGECRTVEAFCDVHVTAQMAVEARGRDD